MSTAQCDFPVSFTRSTKGNAGVGADVGANVGVGVGADVEVTVAKGLADG